MKIKKMELKTRMKPRMRIIMAMNNSIRKDEYMPRVYRVSTGSVCLLLV